jgi:hypothetical protein
MMMVVVFAMLFVILALGTVFVLMVRSHRHHLPGGPLNAGRETHGVK